MQRVVKKHVPTLNLSPYLQVSSRNNPQQSLHWWAGMKLLLPPHPPLAMQKLHLDP